METYYNLTEIKKTPHKYFDFFLNLLENKEPLDYISPIFNIPRIPLIGSKSNQEKNFSHNLGNVLSIISFQINICQGDEKNEIEHDFADFTLPKNLKDYLNIDEVIEIDNNTDEPENNLFFMPKKKLNFYLVFTQLPKFEENKEIKDEDKNEIKDEDKNEIKDEDKNEIKDEIKDEEKNEIKNEININKINIDNDKEEKNMNKINIEGGEPDFFNKFDDNNDYNDYNYNNNDINFEKDYRLFNIVPQFFFINNKEKSLYDIKNMYFQKQITLFCISDKDYYDIDYDRKNKKEFIDIDNLRAENSNIYLDKNNKINIQDNLKFYLKIINDISQFYLIYTSYEDEYHSVFYYITCNNEKSLNKMKTILIESQNLKELLEKMENNFENKQVINNLKRIFKKTK